MRKKEIPMMDLSEGKIPPSAMDVEEMVLGAILMSKDAIEEIIHELPTEAFYREIHADIYTACKNLHAKHEPIDIATVERELKRIEKHTTEVSYIMAGFSLKLMSAANIKAHSKIVAQAYAKREIIRICQTQCAEAFSPTSDPFETFDEIDKQMQACKDSILGGIQSREWSEQVSETISTLENISQSQSKVSGIPTGNIKLDALTGGWQKSDLIIICGRPGSGKTTRVLNFIKHACIAGQKTIMFSLEMGYRQITKKFISEQSDVFGNKLISGDITNSDWDKISDAKGKLIDLPFHLNDKGGITPSYIRNTLKQRKKKHGVDFVIIDYVQLMKPSEMIKGRTRDSEIGSISTSLKNIAKEFDIPILLLAQLNRKCEERTDKRPMLSDLRESGSLENDSDMVIGLYRPSYYHTYEHPDKEYADDIEKGNFSEEQYKRASELHVLKHRNGQVDKYIREKFYGETSRFIPIDQPVLTHYVNNFIEPSYTN